MFSKLAFVSALAALLTTTSGHMLISQPAPYGAASLNNSPLDKAGSDYPCKQRPGVYDAAGTTSPMNSMAVGAPQTLAFKGSAVHGGGSCQISLTTDKNPTKDSVFKVVHSIIGGCPANTAGNLPADPSGSGASKFNYSIPDDVPAGDYTFAWTWFNKIGNREMYMNCAPITVTGSKGTKDTFDKLPNMFIANVGQGTATVKDSTNVVFPEPGKSVETDAHDALTPPDCPPSSNGCTAPPGGKAPPAVAGGSSGGSAGAPPAGGSSGGSSGGAAPAAPAAPVASSPGPVGPAGAGASPSAQAPATPAAASPAQAPATPGIAPPTTGGVPCTNPGQVVCIGDSQFGICDITNSAIPQALAQGTHCSGGKIQKRAIHGASLQARGAAKSHGHGKSHQH